MTDKLKRMQRLAMREKRAKSSKFLIQQNTTTGRMRMATHAYLPMMTPKAWQNT